MDSGRRRKDFGLGEICELDDFPYVWEAFEIDDILSRYGRPRVFTDPDYTFKDDRMMWALLIERINLEYQKRLARDPRYLEPHTLFIEFARGGPSGIRDALTTLDPAILAKASVLYLDVTYEESLRRNRRRSRPGQADSILYHSLPDQKMERYYRTHDWQELSAGKSQGFLKVRDAEVPFAVFSNEDDKTADPGRLAPALSAAFAALRAQRSPMRES
jgi:hypothetical protein